MTMYAVDFHDGHAGYAGYSGKLSLPQALTAARTGRDPRSPWFNMSRCPVAIIHRHDQRELIFDHESGEEVSALTKGLGHVIHRPVAK